jgi:hypothetical protein
MQEPIVYNFGGMYDYFIPPSLVGNLVLGEIFLGLNRENGDRRLSLDVQEKGLDIGKPAL